MGELVLEQISGAVVEMPAWVWRAAAAAAALVLILGAGLAALVLILGVEVVALVLTMLFSIVDPLTHHLLHIIAMTCACNLLKHQDISSNQVCVRSAESFAVEILNFQDEQEQQQVNNILQ